MSWRSRKQRSGWLWTDESGTRLLAAFAIVACVISLPWGGQLLVSSFQPRPAAGTGSESRPPREPAMELPVLGRALERRVVAAELSLGEALIELHHAELGHAQLRSFDLEPTLARYRRTLEHARARLAAGSAPVRAVVAALERAGLTAYASTSSRLSDAFLSGSANCEATSHLIVGLLYDLGFERQTYLRKYSNHLAPELVLATGTAHFGLTQKCSGRGTRLRPLELLTRFRAPASPGALGWFEYPEAEARCIDPATLFAAGLPLSASDSVPGFWQDAGKKPRGCAFPRLQWLASAEQVWLAFGTRAETAEVLRPTPELLDAQSRNIACVDTLLQQTPDIDERLPFLGAQVGHYERGALLSAAAGQARLVKELERRRDARLQEAELLILQLREHRSSSKAILARLETREVWPLVFLGASGQDLLFELEETARSPSAVAALLLHEASRERALSRARRLAATEQLELLGLLSSLPGRFLSELSEHSAGERWQKLHALSTSVEQRWQGCSLHSLLGITQRSVEAMPAFRDFALPLSLRLATQRVAGACLQTRLASELRSFSLHIERSQAERVRRELDLIAMLE